MKRETILEAKTRMIQEEGICRGCWVRFRLNHHIAHLLKTKEKTNLEYMRTHGLGPFQVLEQKESLAGVHVTVINTKAGKVEIATWRLMKVAPPF